MNSALTGNDFERRLRSAIPGGSHTYSRGRDQFPAEMPAILARGKGCYVWDAEGTKYLDYGMGLRSVAIGYAEKTIISGASRAQALGNTLTLPHLTELAAAEKALEIFPTAEMVKFAKNGSNATTAAVKLARAYTGRTKVAAPIEQPFFSFDDWFIASTVMERGVAPGSQKHTLRFNYNSVESLESLFQEFPGDIACVILEPTTSITPCSDHESPLVTAEFRGPCEACQRKGSNLLSSIKELCHKYGALYISDEMISGFRWSVEGAATSFGVEPDISTFGKAVANGFSLALLVGKKEFMRLGSIEPDGAERTFLLSSTHGAEMGPLGAFMKTIEFYRDRKVIDHLWSYGKALRQELVSRIDTVGLSNSMVVAGPDVLLSLEFTTGEESRNRMARTLFMQEMVRNGVIMPWIAPSYRHDGRALKKTQAALEVSLTVVKRALETDNFTEISGGTIKPVFRKFN